MLFERPGGAALRRRIDEMSNEEYQALIRLPGAELRSRIIDCQGIDKAEIAAAIQDIPDETLPSVLSNLGGHDLEELLAMLSQAETEPEKPTIIFAYTIKGWGLPIAGHPLNHSMLLSETQIADLRERSDVSASDDWARFDPGSSAGQLCLEVADRLFPHDPAPPVTLSADDVPTDLSLPTQGFLSTQQSLGRLLDASDPCAEVGRSDCYDFAGRIGVYQPIWVDYQDRVCLRRKNCLTMKAKRINSEAGDMDRRGSTSNWEFRR